MPAKTTKAAPARARASRSEVQQEFENVRREVDPARETATAKTLEAAERHAAEVRETVDGISVASVAQQISSLGGQISRTLMELSEKLTAEVDLLAGSAPP